MKKDLLAGFFLLIFLALLFLTFVGTAEAQIVSVRTGWQWSGGRGGYGYGYDGYGYGGYGYRIPLTGIKFNLTLVAKKDRDAAKRGIVTVDGGEVGLVNSFDGFWNGVMRLCPGKHQVRIEWLSDEDDSVREFQTQVDLMPGQIRSIFIRPIRKEK